MQRGRSADSGLAEPGRVEAGDYSGVPLSVQGQQGPKTVNAGGSKLERNDECLLLASILRIAEGKRINKISGSLNDEMTCSLSRLFGSAKCWRRRRWCSKAREPKGRARCSVTRRMASSKSPGCPCGRWELSCKCLPVPLADIGTRVQNSKAAVPTYQCSTKLLSRFRCTHTIRGKQAVKKDFSLPAWCTHCRQGSPIKQLIFSQVVRGDLLGPAWLLRLLGARVPKQRGPRSWRKLPTRSGAPSLQAQSCGAALEVTWFL